MSGWKSNDGLSDDTALVKLYPPQKHKETWRQEAEEHGSSMSRYLQELIQEARFQREQGQLKLGDKRKVRQLQQEVEELEKQLENRSETRVEPQTLIEEDHVEQALTDSYTPLNQLLEDLLQQEEFRQKLRLELETHLYRLGDEARVVFRRGKGWKTNNGGDQ